MEKRLTDLEIQLMHQDNTIQQLNEVVIRQQQMIEKLSKDVAQLIQHLQAMAPSAIGGAEDEEPPPHY